MGYAADGSSAVLLNLAQALLEASCQCGAKDCSAASADIACLDLDIAA